MNDQRDLDLLRRANARLSLFFTQFSGGSVLDAQEELRMLLPLEDTLRSVEVLLQQGIQQSDDGRVRDELVTYRANLVRLQRELSARRNSALAARARLSIREEHLRSARAWFAVSQATH